MAACKLSKELHLEHVAVVTPPEVRNLLTGASGIGAAAGIGKFVPLLLGPIVALSTPSNPVSANTVSHFLTPVRLEEGNVVGSVDEASRRAKEQLSRRFNGGSRRRVIRFFMPETN